MANKDRRKESRKKQVRSLKEKRVAKKAKHEAQSAAGIPSVVISGR